MGRVNKYKQYLRSPLDSLPRRSRHRLRQIIADEQATCNIVDSILSSKLQKPSLNLQSQLPESVETPEPELFECNDSKNELDDELCDTSDSLNAEEIINLISAFVLRHRLTKQATNDLLTLLRLVKSTNFEIPANAFTLKQKLQLRKDTYKTHYFCHSCKTSVGSDLDQNKCSNCGAEISLRQLVEMECYFYTFDVRYALLSLLQSREVSSDLYHRLDNRRLCNASQNLKDISDGYMYKNLNLRCHDFTCSINTDGIAPFRSSKSSIWPVLLSVNELSYSVRRANTILAGLWFGQEKPSFETLFTPIVEMCNELSTNELQWECENQIIKSFVYFPIFVADSVARCVVQGMNQFNGNYGCPWCLSKGETYWMDEERRSRKWIYRFMESPLRTAENFEGHLRELQERLCTPNFKQDSFMGIKSASQLLLLKKFNIVHGFVYDIMHSAYLGVAKMMTSFWFDSTNHHQIYYVGKHLQLVDTHIKRCRFPFEYNRTLRSITLRKFWKASEWRNWIFLASTILKGILPEVYRSHLTKLSNCLMLMSDETITSDDIKFCEETLKSFARQTEDLYGIQSCTFNLHILTHAPMCVRNWGPLWSYSAFQYENYNGILSNLFNGSRMVITQIKTKILELIELQRRGRKQFQNLPASDFFQAMMLSKRFSQKFKKLSNNIVFLGPFQNYVFSSDEQNRLKVLGIKCFNGDSYKKCIINEKIYSRFDQGTSKRSNAVVATMDGKIWILHKLILIRQGGGVGIALVSRIHGQPSCINSYLTTINHIDDVWVTLNLTTISRQKYIAINGNSNTMKYLIRIPNVVELE